MKPRKVGLRAWSVAFLVATSLAGCGTRVSVDRGAALPNPVAPTGSTASSASQLVTDTGAVTSAAAPKTTGVGAASAKPDSGPAGASPSVGMTSGLATKNGGGAAAASPKPTEEPRGGKPVSASPSVVPVPGAPAGGVGARSPAVIATVGTLSGPAGNVFTPYAQAVQMWSKYVNDRGGLNGHMIKLLVYDDGGDPARHRAQVQEAIERQHVIAMVSNPEGLAGESSVDYVTAKRVPVIGSETGSPWFYRSPMYFPQASTHEAMLYGGIATAAQVLGPTGKKKVGSATCVESQICRDAKRVWSESAADLGLEFVYGAEVSFAQPDFTAECLRARNAGVEMFLIGSDTNSIQRFAASCARQGYRPVFAAPSSVVADRLKDDPNVDGMLGSSNVFPYFQTGTPATDEFQRVFKQYGGSSLMGVNLAQGWVSAKLFELAAAALPEPPTSEAILKGLWSIRQNSLGGLTQALTFIENAPAAKVSCWFNLRVHKGAWVSTDGFQSHCR